MERKACTQEYEIPVREQCDVAVIGAGAAGTFAAVEAARSGVKTVLIEKAIILGGCMVTCDASIGGLTNREGVCEPPLLQELVERLKKSNGASPFYRTQKDPAFRMHADREQLPLVLEDMLLEAGVSLYVRCIAVNPVVQAGRVRGVVIQSKGGREAILAHTVIDCSGTGLLPEAAGSCAVRIPEREQIGMTFGLGKVNLEKACEYAQQKGLLLDCAKDRGRVISLDLEVTDPQAPECPRALRLTSLHEGRAEKISGVTVYADALDIPAFSAACQRLNDTCHRMADLLMKSIPGFEQSYLDWTSHAAGCRFVRSVPCEEIYDGSSLKLQHLIPRNTEGLLIAGKSIAANAAYADRLCAGDFMRQGILAGRSAAQCAKESCLINDLVFLSERRETK